MVQLFGSLSLMSFGSGAVSLAYLGARDADDTGVVRLDRDRDMHFRGAVLCDGFVEGGLEAEREAATGECRRADDELAAGELLAASEDHFFHGSLLTTCRWCDRPRGHWRRCRRRGAPPRGYADRCRSGICWSSPRRCRHRLASAFS